MPSALAEVRLINHIIKTGDIVTPLNGDVDKSFVLYTEEWNWLKDYYVKYREVPSEKDYFGSNSVDRIDTEGSMEFYIDEIHKYRAALGVREMITEAASRLNDRGPFDVINFMNKSLAKIGSDTKIVKDIDLINNAEKRLESLRNRIEIIKSGKGMIGMPTGIPKLDKMYQGLQRGDFWVLAGNTGSLKSYLALYIAKNVWLAGYRVLYFTLEMSSEQIGYRFDSLVGEGEFKSSELTHATDPYIIDRYQNWMDTTFKGREPFVVVSNEDLDEVNQNTVLAKIEQWRPNLVVLDYHSLFDDARGAQGETEKFKNLSKDFKRIAIKTGVSMIDITSVTQDKGDIGKRVAKLHELAWSKQLGYDSDLCLSVFKEDDILQVEAVKTRRSQAFRFLQRWDIDAGIVHNLDKDSYTESQESSDDDSKENSELSGKW